MLETAPKPISASTLVAKSTTEAFRIARLAGEPLTEFPGAVPATLAQSYSLQDEAIAAWPDAISGWKVGRILGELEQVHGTNRLIGPIFKSSIQFAKTKQNLAFSAIVGGFCAVESEFVFELAKDAEPTRQNYTPEAALALVKTLWTGIEIAGSPLATINALGPTVVVTDFGNNKGLILGGEVDGWRARLNDLTCTMKIDGQPIGEGHVNAFPGGIVGSLVFALNCAAGRGLPLKAGMYISTGAVTGVHDIGPGQSACAGFGPDGTILCNRVT